MNSAKRGSVVVKEDEGLDRAENVLDVEGELDGVAVDEFDRGAGVGVEDVAAVCVESRGA